MLKNTQNSYGLVAKCFHWGVGVITICLLALGLYMTSLPSEPFKFQLYSVHKSFGVVALFLVVARLWWKLRNVSVSMPRSMKKWQTVSASLAHKALYFFMFAMPISGWVMSNAAGYPVGLFDWFNMPEIVSKNEFIHEIAESAHTFLGYSLIALLVAHVAAALLHHFYYKDNVLRGMLPFSKPEEGTKK